ncbi:MAG: B12-binding domain-containing radical SAM protein [Candidatus Thorarchaeota archaeon]|nr:MAG: B12-binding domain-containing radical SAM protein [Candidatus Thorarchaeota archaeon]
MSDRVLIIDALSAGDGRRTRSRDSIGCGPRTIAGVFEKKQIGCRIARSEDITSRSQLKGFEHLALSAMTMDIPVSRRLVKMWRNANKGRVLVGGPVSSDITTVLELVKPDVMIIGEGEVTLEELLKVGFLNDEVDLSEIKGIAYSSSSGPVVTSERTPIPEGELEKYRPSTFRILDYRAYAASKVYVETVRGCSNYRRTRLELGTGRMCSECGGCDADDPGERLDCPEEIPPGCGFCSVPATWGPPRSRSTESIVDEVRELLDLGAHRVVLEAPDFLDYRRGQTPLTDPCYPPANLRAIEELLNAIAALDSVSNEDARISIENVKACLFTEEVARVISDTIPGTSPNIGLETGSESHLRAIGKCGSPGDVLQAIQIARRFGMTPFVYLIFGLPGETEETVDESIRLMQKLSETGAERIILYGFRALPGSAFEGFPEPTGGHSLGIKMQKAAAKINRSKKKDYVGRIIRGIAAEESWARHGYTMVYPFDEGPIMTIQGGFSPGTMLDVEVTEVLSDGLLLGQRVKKNISG